MSDPASFGFYSFIYLFIHFSFIFSFRKRAGAGVDRTCTHVGYYGIVGIVLRKTDGAVAVGVSAGLVLVLVLLY